MANKPSRSGAVRKTKKGPLKGSGGQGRQALEGKKPTPKAEDRPYHPAGKRKLAKDRYEAASAGANRGRDERAERSAPPRARATDRPAGADAPRARRAKQQDESEVVT
ncbi:23S rRNA (guanosine(2251)-2'-O)-methyltransferase RlmB, partial [Clavibacter michiganensis subsp. insidiosus]